MTHLGKKLEIKKKIVLNDIGCVQGDMPVDETYIHAHGQKRLTSVTES